MVDSAPEAVESLRSGERIEVDGVVWASATGFHAYATSSGDRHRVFYRTRRGEQSRTFASGRVRIVADAAAHPAAGPTMRYWREVVDRLPPDNAYRRAYSKLRHVHPDSALARYLTGAPIRVRPLGGLPVFPFNGNLSQRAAVETALTRNLSVIEGPPGTGKTETILNLIANILTAGLGTVGVVSFTNAAVDNVREKLDDLGFGHVIANLGSVDKQREFFSRQAERNRRVARFRHDDAADVPDPERLATVDGRLRQLQEVDRTRAELRSELDAYRLERRHFEAYLYRQEAPELDRLPLLRRSSDRILDYLVEAEIEHLGDRPGVLRRIRRYLRYGSLASLDPDDTGAALRLQHAYYDKRIAELARSLEQADRTLARTDFTDIAAEHKQLSLAALHAALGARYGDLAPRDHALGTYRTGRAFKDFTSDYPVILSTCHSIRRSVGDGYLLDYLVIDEASQVDLLAAGLALSCCRNLVVVGDLKQLPHIPEKVAADIPAPNAAHDYQRNSILSSLVALYGEALPRTLLREHYRCDPTIIGFCNQAFYDGQLIAYTSGASEPAMTVWRTREGNHMREHRGGGRSNRREVDVIAGEVIPANCRDVPASAIGVTTPYRRQVDKVVDAIVAEIEADTVHKFQGRQKDVIILTTVLDETWRGQIGLRFVDDPHLINVAISRASRRFILVTNNHMVPKSRHIRDLVDYIRYCHPDPTILESEIVSIFDLLYRDYSRRLVPLAARRKHALQYDSEDIAFTVLHDILAEDRYAHLTVVSQVLLQNLLPDLDGLTSRQRSYVRHRASVDFVVYNRVSKRPLLAIEVDGFKYHENNPEQQERDALKDDILHRHGFPLLRLPTTGSGEEQQIRAALDAAERRTLQAGAPPS